MKRKILLAVAFVAVMFTVGQVKAAGRVSFLSEQWSDHARSDRLREMRRGRCVFGAGVYNLVPSLKLPELKGRKS